MKKILTVSIMAVMAVTAANAEIASKAYVNKEDNAVKAIIGALSGLNEGITNSTVVDAINSVATTSSGALNNYYTKSQVDTELGKKANTADLGTLASKSIVETADIDAKAVTAEKLSDAVNASLSKAESAQQPATTLAGYGIADAYTKDEANTQFVEQTQAATDAAAGIIKIATDAEATAGMATNVAVTPAQLKTASDTSALAGRLSTAETEISGIKSSAYATSGITSAKVGQYDAYATGKQDTLTTAQLAAVNSGIDGNAVAQIDINKVDIETLNSGASVEGSVAYQIAEAETTLNNAIDAKADKATTLAGYGITDGVKANTAIAAGASNSIVTYDTKGLVTGGTTAGALAIKDTIVNADVAGNAAIDMSKIAMPTTIANGSTEAWGTYSLTADVGANGITYKWELIERAQ